MVGTASARPGQHETVWVRRRVDPIELEIRKGSRLAVMLLDPDFDGLVHWDLLDGPGGGVVAAFEEDPLPDPELVPFPEWSLTHLHRYAVEHGVEVDGLPDRNRKVTLIERILAAHADEQEQASPPHPGSPAAPGAEHEAGASGQAPASPNYYEMSVGDLLALCEQRGVEVNPRSPKPALVRKLVDADAAGAR